MTDVAATDSIEIAPPPPVRPGGLSRRALIVRVVIGIVLAAVALYIPQYYGSTTTKLFAEAIYLAVAAMGLNLLTGFNGQVSIGHGAFFGIGAYTTGILMVNHGWGFYATIPVAAVIAAVVGAAVGFPALRIKGLYLALVTLGLAALMPLIITKYVKGSGGTTLVQPTPVLAPSWMPYSIVPRGGDDIWRYYVALAVAAILFLLAANMVRSRVGRAMIAIRDREIAAETVGVNVPQVKVVTFALSAAYAGVAGSLAVLIDGVAQSGQLIFFQLSIEFLVAVVVGGAATLAGPAIGALAVVWLQKFTSDHSSNEVLSPAIFGGLLIVLMYTMPDGIVGGVRRLQRAVRRRRAPSEPPSDPA
jgi:branched-chain amino acid transport system permease protein